MSYLLFKIIKNMLLKRARIKVWCTIENCDKTFFPTWENPFYCEIHNPENCRFEGCKEPVYVKKKRLCKTHYAQYHKNQDLKKTLKMHYSEYQGNTCIVKDCDKSIHVKKKHLCKTHYRYLYRNKPLKKIKLVSKKGSYKNIKCKFDDCNRNAKTKGYCMPHYTQKYIIKQKLKTLKNRRPRNKNLHEVLLHIIKNSKVKGKCLLHNYSYNFYYNNKVFSLNRYIYFYFKKSILDNKQLLHTCGNYNCINVDHMYQSNNEYKRNSK